MASENENLTQSIRPKSEILGSIVIMTKFIYRLFVFFPAPEGGSGLLSVIALASAGMTRDSKELPVARKKAFRS